MKRYLEADSARVRKIYVSEEKKIGSRVRSVRVKAFPFGEVPMPSVETRRSTRVFVPKSVLKSSDSDAGRVFVPKSVLKSSDSDAVRVLRSGKRQISSESVIKKKEGEEDEWLRLIGNPRRDATDLAGKECDPAGIDAGGAPESGNPAGISGYLAGIFDRDRMCGIVYNRKRRRLPEARVLIDRMYGISFVRKQRRKKLILAPRNGILEGDTVHELNKGCEFADTFANLPNFVRGRALLVAFVEYSHVSSYRFVLFLALVLGWMRRSRLRLSELAIFLSLESIARIFSIHGVHFLAVPTSENHLSCSTSYSGAFPAAGICTIFGARRFVPLVSLNFAVAPLYFMSLLSGLFLGSLYLPCVLVRYLEGPFENASKYIGCIERDSCIPTEMGISRSKIVGSGSPAMKRSAVDSTVESTKLAAQNVAVRHSVKLEKHQTRRNSMRSSRVTKKPLTTVKNGGLRSELDVIMKLHSADKASQVENGLAVSTCEKSLDVCGGGFFGIRDNNAVFSSPRTSHRKRKFARNSSAEKVKELDSASIDLKQNIDSLHCSVNILVVESDRCRRECGAEVMLECSDSKEWLLVVKARGLTRYLHKAQEMKPSTSNHYTHAMMWSCESGWKLEFCDRKDWSVFKELHRECCERNMQGATVRIIPVPGVREVFGYGDGEAVPFVRPEVYITTSDDEVRRALVSENTNYDMDSVDEEWLDQLNCNFLDSDGSAGHISEDNFEKIIYVFEKAAYIHPDNVSDENRAISLCLDLGRRDMVAAVYEYWLRKRKQKNSGLVRVFQGQPPERAQLLQTPFLRRKRSFKRRASQFGRGKPECFLQAALKQEAIKKVQEAEHAANRAAELAIVKRSKAQMLMQNADLATYKSIIALKIAEAAEESLEAASMVLGGVLDYAD
ncbi:uncharacterized protein LOC143881824 [Tasmannia lanceolata]|uniref:uncharacterized protein LOC143881824 n=1 Tax=Tasmannia lanceolata TaxID=3420 RepID=UPI004062EBAF